MVDLVFLDVFSKEFIFDNVVKTGKGERLLSGEKKKC